jgi:hypothetical protein
LFAKTRVFKRLLTFIGAKYGKPLHLFLYSRIMFAMETLPDSSKLKSVSTMRNIYLLALGMLGLTFGVQAQNGEADLPPGAEPGKCYAKCIMPDVYETKEEQILVKEKSFQMEIIPAEFKEVYDTIVIKPASKKIIEVPAEYEIVEERVKVADATTKWVKGKADANCLSANPDDCRVLCLVEVPAQYKTVTKRVIKSPTSTKEIIIPAEYKVVKKNVMVKAASTRQIEIPAEYKAVTKNVLVKSGGWSDWKEVLCANQVTKEKIRAIQMALASLGYDPGPADNVLGPQTRKALLQYQKDNNLPQGNLNKETLQALGVL